MKYNTLGVLLLVIGLADASLHRSISAESLPTNSESSRGGFNIVKRSLPALNADWLMTSGLSALEEANHEIGKRSHRDLERPTALAAGDFDEDGIPDLLVGYATTLGGLVVLQPGNADSIYPNSPRAQRRKVTGTFTDSPFLSPACIISLPEVPDLIGAGDFDADGNQDVVTGTVGRRRLFFLTGDGRGNFGSPRIISLSGALTGMAIGEINRADGLRDIVVGVATEAGGAVEVYQGPRGAFNSGPDRIATPLAPDALSLGRLDEDPFGDLAIGAGKHLLLMYGRDRRLILGRAVRSAVSPPLVESMDFPSEIISLAWGDFVGESAAKNELAVLDRNGTLSFLSRPQSTSENWGVLGELQLFLSHARTFNPPRSTIIPLRVSGLTTDDLVILDGQDRTLQVLSRFTRSNATGDSTESFDLGNVSDSMNLSTEPVAALPMRLNEDALDDLVLLEEGTGNLSVAMTAPRSVITVNSTADNIESGDGQCTLREAISNANSNTDDTGGDCAAGGGVDMIAFSIGGGGATATIQTQGLPGITDPLTIDGTTQGCTTPPCIELDGSLVGANINGLTLETGSSTVRGLAINRFSQHGIAVLSSGNIIEGNFLGTDLTGTEDLGNGSTVDGAGIRLEGSSNNVIGGANEAARNVMSGNTFQGITIRAGSNNNEVQGNHVGTDVSGTMVLGNDLAGLKIQDSMNNTIGGTADGEGNVFSGNAINGVLILEIGAPTEGNLFLGNIVGLDASGGSAVGNGQVTPSGSLEINGASLNTIGGTATNARNVFSGNNGGGVLLRTSSVAGDVATGNVVIGNLIGTDVTGTVAVPNTGVGVNIFDSSSNVIGGDTRAAANVISASPGDGVAIGGPGSSGNQILGNLIGTDASGTAPMGNAGRGVRLFSGVTNNEVGGVDAGAGNVIAYNLGEGVAASGTAQGNALLGNSIFSNGLLGIDLGLNGVTPNDPNDPDSGPNLLQNFPVLTLANATTFGITIEGTLSATPSSDFRVELFANISCDGSSHGEGERFLGFTDVTTDPSGSTAFSTLLLVPVADSDSITATATDGAGNTSEFSACLGASCASTVVFGHTLFAPDRNSLTWTTPADVRFAKGDLAAVTSYAVTDHGTLIGASMLDISSDVPALDTGLYYVVKPLGCGSWQTSLGEQPDRDSLLP